MNCSFYLNPETNQLISVREHGEYATYVGPRRLDDDEKNRLLKHGVVGQDQARFNDISWIKHGMTAEDVMTNYNFCNNSSSLYSSLNKGILPG